MSDVTFVRFHQQRVLRRVTDSRASCLATYDTQWHACLSSHKSHTSHNNTAVTNTSQHAHNAVTIFHQQKQHALLLHFTYNTIQYNTTFTVPSTTSATPGKQHILQTQNNTLQNAISLLQPHTSLTHCTQNLLSITTTQHPAKQTRAGAFTLQHDAHHPDKTPTTKYHRPYSNRCVHTAVHNTPQEQQNTIPFHFH